MSTVRSSKDAGDLVEHEVIQRTPELSFVPDSTADWHDARATDPITIGEVSMRGIVSVGEGVPVEIKGAQRRISNGSRTCRGRYYLKRRAHDRLAEAGGVYMLVVYDPNLRGSDPILAMMVVPARVVGEFVTVWSPVAGDRSEKAVAKVPWSRVFDPEIVVEPKIRK